MKKFLACVLFLAMTFAFSSMALATDFSANAESELNSISMQANNPNLKIAFACLFFPQA